MEISKRAEILLFINKSVALQLERNLMLKDFDCWEFLPVRKIALIVTTDIHQVIVIIDLIICYLW